MTLNEYLNYKNNKEKYKIFENLFKCPLCNKIFSNKGFIQHIKKEHYNKENNIINLGKHYSYQSIDFKNKLRIAIDKKYGKIIKKEFICEKCNKIFYVNEREFKIKEHKFCSRHCANSHILSDETKNKISNSVSKSIKEKYLTDNIYRERIIKNNSESKYFTSKNERLIRDYFINNFKNDGWTFGGPVKYNNEIITRDLYSNKLKICIEYDGIWHFKNIHDQLKRKQYKDWCLEQWCIKNDYRLIRISEEWFINNNKNIELIINLIYNNTQKIIKLGNEYNLNTYENNI